MLTPLKFTILFYTSLIFFHIFSHATDFPPCNPQDKAVLLKVRDHFGGTTGRLSDWDNTTDCCSDWSFVGCGTTGKSYGRIDTVTFSRSWGLSGSIPSDFGDLPYLSFFILADNINVTGSLPKSLGKLKRLYHIEMDSNSLIGPIPKELLQLKSLKEVDLSNNKLSGPIPPAVSSLSSLTQFNVSNNQLCGPIPSGLKKFGKTSFDNNKCLCGPPLTPCK
ncbi:polygalacturonase inhibitor 2-like [Amaranthus tricolor]|uniref:polygalacturonase inhibitor 2-like n=1 Tax=Amaranthus tricolor TaxID=29722 RepID=UPI0025881F28|nr:polygalacturonase inhibitor 2-like [Amaranthus tricolor]